MPNPSIFLATHLLFFASSLIASLVFYLWSRPRKSELAGTLIAGILLTWKFGLFGGGYRQAMVFLSYWGLCAITVSFFAPIFFPRQVKQRVPVLEAMVAPPILELFAAVLLGFINRFVPHTLDYYLFAFDGSLGFQPGFAAARLLSRVGSLRIPAEVAYINLTLAISVAYLMKRSRSAREARLFLRLVCLLSIIGSSFYLVFPAVGAEVLFRDDFPNHPPSIMDVATRQTPDTREPRNCMPSLHTVWALALWYTCPRKPIARLGMGAYVAFTLLYTLACGHYLADMILAVPFTGAIYAVSCFEGAKAWQVGLWNAGLFFGGLAMLRFSTALFLVTPAVPWMFAAGIVALSQFLRFSLEPAGSPQPLVPVAAVTA